MALADVMLTLPKRDGYLHGSAADGFYLWPTHRAYKIQRVASESSLLCRSFNNLWARALDQRPDFFAMIHSDIAPDLWWLDTLIDELERLEADVVSAVVPIKTREGVTSTAVDTGDFWHPRRLTMHEIYALPETFGEDDVGAPLLLNTGLWVCDFRKPWVEKVYFRIADRITAQDSQWKPQTVSEDWCFSHDLNRLGAKLYATRLVGVRHMGEQAYPNTSPWGDWKTDENFKARNKEVTRGEAESESAVHS